MTFGVTWQNGGNVSLDQIIRQLNQNRDAELLGAATNHAAFNVGNALGAALGGAVIAGGLGYLAPAWVGAAMAGIGFALALWSIASDRRGAPDTASVPVVATVAGPTTAGIRIVER